MLDIMHTLFLIIFMNTVFILRIELITVQIRLWFWMSKMYTVSICLLERWVLNKISKLDSLFVKSLNMMLTMDNKCDLESILVWTCKEFKTLFYSYVLIGVNRERENRYQGANNTAKRDNKVCRMIETSWAHNQKNYRLLN